MSGPGTLFGSEELGSLRKVVHEEESEECNNDCENAFEDEDPAPALVATYPVHLRNCVCKESGEGTCHRGGRKEKSLALWMLGKAQNSDIVKDGTYPLYLMGAVPHSEIVRDTGVESSFCHAEEQTGDEETVVVLYKTH